MRFLWVLLMISGVVVLGGLSLLRLYGLIEAEGVNALMQPRALISGLLPLFGAGACAAGIFMKPSEFRKAMEPVQEEAPTPPAWLKEMQDRASAKRED
jgi:hypothetical protein